MSDLVWDDRAVQAGLQNLINLGVKPKAVLQDIGEYFIPVIRHRFETSRGPDGTPWQPNSETTLLRMLQARGGLSKRKTKTGGHTLTKKGAAHLAAKKPLIGETRQLSAKIFYRIQGHALSVGSPLEYAAVQQFGARKGEFGVFSLVKSRRQVAIPWGNIPPRPFLGFSEADKRAILAILAEHAERAASG